MQYQDSRNNYANGEKDINWQKSEFEVVQSEDKIYQTYTAQNGLPA